MGSADEKMRRVCAWCGVALTSVSEVIDASQPISHGICTACSQAYLGQIGSSSAQEFLDALGVPVLVVDQDVRVLGASRQAAERLGKSIATLLALKGGDVIECVNAPVGCGKTIHCRSCAIRNTVRTTYETGGACSRVVAYPDVELSCERKTLCLEISTEKVGEVVLLRVDSLSKGPCAP